MASIEVSFDIGPMMEKIRQSIRDELILNTGGLWDEYCYENNVPPEVKLNGISFLEDFSSKLNKRV